MKKTILCFVSIILIFNGASHAQGRDKLATYVYEDTKQLVMLVEEAASLIEKKGEAAFKEFGVENSKWFNDKYYLFVYDLNCNCIFHPIEPGLVGQDLAQFKDLNGRPVIKFISEIGQRPQPDASGWVFYLWEDPSRAPIPHWKSSYVRKAIAPDGTTYLVGSGLYNVKVEKVFIQDCVDMAADLIYAKGKDAAFEELRTLTCPLHILNTYIIVLDDKGDVVVDPAFPTLAKKRNLLGIRDIRGEPFVKAAIEILKQKDRIFKVYVWLKGDTHRTERRLLYIRRIKIGGEVFYVASDFAPATPIWMKR